MMEVKVCGMRQQDNIEALEKLNIQYMGFIFYPPSPRFVGRDFIPPQIHKNIKTIGVFVNEDFEQLIEIIEKSKIDGVQLHGDETPQYCRKLKVQYPQLLLFKAFRIKDAADLRQIEEYENICDRFILDTKAEYYGGNGSTWDYSILKNQQIQTPFLLSGGIGESFDKDQFQYVHPMCLGIDINSKFEIEPGLKDINKLKRFIEHE